jgi:hypothetical protein
MMMMMIAATKMVRRLTSDGDTMTATLSVAAVVVVVPVAVADVACSRRQQPIRRWQTGGCERDREAVMMTTMTLMMQLRVSRR